MCLYYNPTHSEIQVTYENLMENEERPGEVWVGTDDGESDKYDETR